MSEDTVNRAMNPDAWIQFVNQRMSALQQQYDELQSSRSVSLKPQKPDCFHGNSRGEKVDLWIFEFEQYFNAVGVNDPQRVPYAASFLRDYAATWWRARCTAQAAVTSSSSSSSSSSSGTATMTWRQFTAAITQQFKPLNASKIARDRLHRLRQTGSVLQLTTMFNTLCADVPTMSEDEKMDKFRRACKPAIQQKLELEDPRTLFQMQMMAQRLDEIYWKYNSAPNKLPRDSRRPSYKNPDAMELDNIEENEEQNSSVESENDEEEQLQSMRGRSRASKRNPKKSYHKKPNNPKMNYNERVRCMEKGLCFKCKKTGHRIRECPQWKSLKVKAQ
jgi:hypothetical protein